MMMAGDKKRALSIILARAKPDGGEKRTEVKNEEGGDDRDEGLRAIATDLLQAFRDGSVHGIVSALKAFDSENGNLTASEPPPADLE